MWLFRGKGKDGKWRESACSTGVMEDGIQSNFIPDTVCVYTSASDKKQKKIFTNDILRTDKNELGVVKFGRYLDTFGPGDGGHIGFYVEWAGDARSLLRKDLGYWADNAYVIGNTIDNSD